MMRVTAEVTENRQVLRELERCSVAGRPRPRDLLGSWIIRLRCPEIAREAQPGQFVMVSCGEGTLVPRPFSIHQANGGEISIFYSVLDGGKGTGWLSRRDKGDEVSLFGPLGRGFEILPESRNLLLVAGGNGIAPLYFLAARSMEMGKRVVLCLGASGELKPSGEKNPPQLYPLTLLPTGMQVQGITSTEDGSGDMVTELIPDFIDRADQVFACGPAAMYKAMAGMPELKDRTVQVSLEVRMACGRGLCYGCSVLTVQGIKKVCEDGPVFNLGDLVWE